MEATGKLVLKAQKTLIQEPVKIKKRWPEYTEELNKKGLNNPDKHDGVVTNPNTLNAKLKRLYKECLM